jgi:hypothetical protein
VRVLLYCTTHRAKDLRHLLPFVQQDRLGQIPECGIWVGAESDRLSRLIQPNDGLGELASSRRLSGSTWARDHQYGQLFQERGELRVDEAREVANYTVSTDHTPPLARALVHHAHEV